MRVWLSVVVIAAACGRVGFDPVVGGGGSGDDATGSGSGSDSGAGSGSDSGSSGTCSMTACMAAGGTCMGSTCVINVTGAGNVTCPPSLTCVINCNAANACRSGTVDCQNASCTVNCNVGGACTNETFQCGSGSCTVYCRADNTCTSDMFQCGTCDLECCLSNGVCSAISGTIPKNGACP